MRHSAFDTNEENKTRKSHREGREYKWSGKKQNENEAYLLGSLLGGARGLGFSGGFLLRLRTIQ